MLNAHAHTHTHTELKVPHEVLNAEAERAGRESEIVAQAGRAFAITIATNMAGRGTDILLGGNAAFFAKKKIMQKLSPTAQKSSFQ